MKNARTLILHSLIVTIGMVSVAIAQDHIDRVDVAGNQRVERSTILLQLSSRQGSTVEPKKVEADIKELYKTGFFEQVTAKVVNKGNESVLVFQVVERPALRTVLLQGNDKVDEDSIKEKLNVSAQRFLDRRKLQAGMNDVKALYQSKGYYGTKIDYTVTPVPDNQVDVTFNITEGEKKRLREIVFEGNTAFDDGELKDVIKTSEYAWFYSWLTGGGVVKSEQLKADVRELSRFYLTKGYADAKVGEPTVEESEEGITVVFRVEEGEKFQFGNISVKGDLVDGDETKTLDGVQSKSGDTFNVESLRKDTFTISEKFTDIGYAFANVEPVSEINREQKAVNIRFEVDKGALVSVNRINITGNQKTEDHVIRRSLKVNEREQFSSSKVRRSQELLQRLGYFDEVTITPDPSKDQNQVDLNVAVKEGNSGTFSVGAGVSSGEGFIANAKISENNVFGTGNAITLNVDMGTKNENYVASFDNPRLYDSLWSGGIDLSSTEREFDSFDRKVQGGSISFGHPITWFGEEYEDDYKFSLKYELLNIDIRNVDSDAPFLVKEQEGSTVESGITPRLIRNTIDNPLNPTKGSRQVLSVEVAGLGGDEEFWLGEGSSTIYYPLFDTSFGPFIFSQRTRVGYGETFNDDDFPLYKRYFPGGINSVRGYSTRKLGPKDENGQRYGGSKELIGNFEMILPLVNQIGLKGVLFFDAGEAFDDNENIDVGELRLAFGYGIRWNSPLGPIRVEIGYPLDKEEGESSPVTQFSFGAPL